MNDKSFWKSDGLQGFAFNEISRDSMVRAIFSDKLLYDSWHTTRQELRDSFNKTSNSIYLYECGFSALTALKREKQKRINVKPCLVQQKVSILL